MAVDEAGGVLTATHPTGGPGAWKDHDLRQGFNPIVGLSCPTASLCVGYDNAGNVVASRSPAARRSAWSVFHLDDAGISSLECVLGPICFGLDKDGNVLLSRDPAGGARAWVITRVDATNAPAGVSCASPSLCVVAEAGGDVASSTDPTGGTDAWTVAHADTALGAECGKYGPDDGCDPGLNSVSCPSTTFCAASDTNGNVIASTDPATGTYAWTLTGVDDWPTFGYITCPSVSLCVKFDDYSTGLGVSADPSGAPAKWHVTDVDPNADGVGGVTCRSATLCVGYDSAGNVVTSTNPAGSASTWKVANIDPGQSLTVTCSPNGRCIAIDPIGNAFTSARPAAGRSSWSQSNVDTYALTTASCPSMALCLAADGYGRIVVGQARRTR